MNRINFTALVLLAIALGGCSNEEIEAPKKSGGPPPAKVEVVKIEATALLEVRRFLGDVRNAESAVLAAGGAGTVTRIEVLEGDQVKRGQVLVQLDDSIQRARLREAQAATERTNVQLGQAQRDVDRFGKLSEKGHFPPSETEQATSQKNALEMTAQGQQASVQRLKEEIAQMRVVAPFDGVVARRHVSRGQWLQTGEPAIELSSNGTLEVFVRVPAEVLDSLSADHPAEIVQGTNRTAAEVAGIVGSLDRRTRTALLRVVPLEPTSWLRQGDAVDAMLSLQRDDVGVVVPSDAIVQGVAGTKVFRITDGKAEPHDVRVVIRAGDQVLVEAPNLKLTDSIVVRGNERLRPGQDVQVTP